MKHLRLSIIIATFLLGVNSIHAIDAFVQPCIFYTAKHEPYAEIRLFISDKGFNKIVTKDSAYFYRAVITLLLKRGSEVLKAEKIVLNSPEGKFPPPLIHQIKWALESDCELETKIEDEQNPLNEITLLNKLTVSKKSGPFISGIQLSAVVRSSSDSNHILYKNGLYSEPLIYQQYTQGQNILNGYFETYASNQLGKTYLLKFIVSKKDSLGNFIQKEEWFKKRNSVAIDPFVLKHDISTYTSGTYQLIVQVLDSKQLVKDIQAIEFTRENPFWDKIDKYAAIVKEDKKFFDEMTDSATSYAIRSMYPLIWSVEASVLNDLFKNKREEEKRIFLFDYWSRESDLPKRSARAAFQSHIILAQKVDKMFYSGFGYGFETDRGFMYMKYGNPDEMISEDKDNGAFPYEIWKYNKIAQTGQTNVKFLFYNPDLAGGDFRLLHSTAHGERHNKNWELELYRSVPDEVKNTGFSGAPEVQPNFNRRAREYFKY